MGTIFFDGRTGHTHTHTHTHLPKSRSSMNSLTCLTLRVDAQNQGATAFHSGEETMVTIWDL